MSEAAEEIVEAWLKQRGYFVMRNIRLRKNKEIDFLAIRLREDRKEVEKKCHIEVQVSPYSRAIGKPFWPPECWAEDYIKKKFDDEDVREEVKRKLGKNYERVLILGSYGQQKPNKAERMRLIKEFEIRGIRVVKFEDVLKEVMESLGTETHREPSIKTLQLIKFMKEW